MGLFAVGEFVFDGRTGELQKGPARRRLRPQPAAVLQYLVNHAGGLVTRDELHRVLWPAGVFVEFDDGLNSCIKQLRAAFGDDPGAPRYIETLTRRGYRLVATVTRIG